MTRTNDCDNPPSEDQASSPTAPSIYNDLSIFPTGATRTARSISASFSHRDPLAMLDVAHGAFVKAAERTRSAEGPRASRTPPPCRSTTPPALPFDKGPPSPSSPLAAQPPPPPLAAPAGPRPNLSTSSFGFLATPPERDVSRGAPRAAPLHGGSRASHHRAAPSSTWRSGSVTFPSVNSSSSVIFPNSGNVVDHALPSSPLAAPPFPPPLAAPAARPDSSTPPKRQQHRLHGGPRVSQHGAVPSSRGGSQNSRSSRSHTFPSVNSGSSFCFPDYGEHHWPAPQLDPRPAVNCPVLGAGDRPAEVDFCSTPEGGIVFPQQGGAARRSCALLGRRKRALGFRFPREPTDLALGRFSFSEGADRVRGCGREDETKKTQKASASTGQVGAGDVLDDHEDEFVLIAHRRLVKLRKRRTILGEELAPHCRHIVGEELAPPHSRARAMREPASGSRMQTSTTAPVSSPVKSDTPPARREAESPPPKAPKFPGTMLPL